MPTFANSQAMMDEAMTWSRKDLVNKWRSIRSNREISGWAPGKAFEYLVIRAFQLEETDVRWPFEVTYPQKFGIVEQLDGIVYVDHRPFIIESKDRNDAVTIGTVAKLRFRLEKRPPGTMAVLFSVGRISTPTEVFAQFASPLNVLLWSAADMEVALHSSGMTDGLRRKFAHAVQYGLPLLPLASKK
jgi:hypothetical protein